jgi:WD40 repeat protein
VASFSTTLRNEVDLDQLREQVLVVVQEAMQPTHVSLWLKEYGRQPQQQYGLVTAEQAASRQTSSSKLETVRIDISQEMRWSPASGISRRAVILGLVTGGIALAGGVLGQWLLRHYPIFTYRGHSGGVFDAAWSPNGTRIASCSGDTTVQVWDASDGGNVFTYQGHSDFVYAVAWFPDGTRIASSSKDKTVQVWDASEGGHVFTYRGHKDQVTNVAWSPDGKRIASGGGNPDETNTKSDRTVQVWDASDGGHVLTYRGHTDTVFGLAWSPDGKRIASGGYDTTVQVWDAVDGGNVFTYRGHTADVSTIAWSPDGRRIASGSGDYTVQVWNAVDGGNVFTYRGHTDWLNSVDWSPDGKRIASGGGGSPNGQRDYTVQVWDAANGGHVFVYNGHTDIVLRVAWSPDGTLIASASNDKTVQIWSPG